MFILKTLSKETIWGGKRLHDFSGDHSINNLGQLYTVIAKEGYSNEIINGKYKGDTLYSVYKKNREIFNYNKYEEFPLIIGFVDAKENLSLQIHPTDTYALENEGKPFGKNESWIFIEEPQEGYIYNGCKLKTIKEVEDKVNNNQWSEIIDILTVKTGDYVYVESGTFHALTAGSLVYEIQQSTDLTYRFYDYDRIDSKGNKRELHFDKALAVLDPLKKSKSFRNKQKIKFNEKYYSIMTVNIKGKYKNISNSFQCITLINGCIEVDNILVKSGMSIIMLKGEEIEFKGQSQIVIAEGV